jgi:LDH2 family malate/lactate/ureidoglycolate dehydrogenase
MSATTPSSELLDQDTPDTVRLSVPEATTLGSRALHQLGFADDQDYGFLFIAFDPGLLIPADAFKRQVSELIDRIKATPRQPGVPQIRIPSERAFRERERRRVEGLVFDRAVVEALQALAAS